MNALTKALEEYLALRRALGFKLRHTANSLPKFVRFVEREGADFITTELALRWAQEDPEATSVTHADRLAMVRRFAAWRSAEDPRTESLEDILAASAAAAIEEGKREGVDLFRVPDRGEAILKACQMAQAGDVVIVCGKGHEQSMCFGTTEYPWDDREAMRQALRGKPLNSLPTAD